MVTEREPKAEHTTPVDRNHHLKASPLTYSKHSINLGSFFISPRTIRETDGRTDRQTVVNIWTPFSLSNGDKKKRQVGKREDGRQTPQNTHSDATINLNL